MPNVYFFSEVFACHTTHIHNVLIKKTKKKTQNIKKFLKSQHFVLLGIDN